MMILKMINKRSQVGIELVILLSFVMFFFIIFLVIINLRISEKVSEQEGTIITDIAQQVQEEINLAFSSADGYRRTFRLPEEINKKVYNINLTDGGVYVRMSDNTHAISLPVKEIEGEVNRGLNTIIKDNGIIKINTFLQIGTVFENNDILPSQYSFENDNENPELRIISVPSHVGSYVLSFDRIYQANGTINHWIIFNISNETLTIEKGVVPDGAIVGKNSYGFNEYRGPSEEDSESIYEITIYAISQKELNLPENHVKEEVMEEIENSIFDRAKIRGYY